MRIENKMIPRHTTDAAYSVAARQSIDVSGDFFVKGGVMSLAKRIHRSIKKNVDLFYDNGRTYDRFSVINCKLWDKAMTSGNHEKVTELCRKDLP